MARRLIDISVTLESGIKSDPDFMVPKIDYATHEATTGDICAFFPGLTKDDLPEAANVPTWCRHWLRFRPVRNKRTLIVTGQ